MQLRRADQRRRPVRLVEQDIEMKKSRKSKTKEEKRLTDAQKLFLERAAKVKYIRPNYTFDELTSISRQFYDLMKSKKITCNVDFWTFVDNWNVRGLETGYEFLPVKFNIRRD